MPEDEKRRSAEAIAQVGKLEKAHLRRAGVRMPTSTAASGERQMHKAQCSAGLCVAVNLMLNGCLPPSVYAKELPSCPH